MCAISRFHGWGESKELVVSAEWGHVWETGTLMFWKEWGNHHSPKLFLQRESWSASHPGQCPGTQDLGLQNTWWQMSTIYHLIPDSFLTSQGHLYQFLVFKFKKKFLFWLHCAACGISVPPTGIEPLSPALEAWSLNHLTAREVLTFMFCVLLLDQVQTGYADFSWWAVCP